jgi:16S rRNA G527 N7-methylase RsmG
LYLSLAKLIDSPSYKKQRPILEKLAKYVEELHLRSEKHNLNKATYYFNNVKDLYQRIQYINND